MVTFYASITILNNKSTHLFYKAVQQFKNWLLPKLPLINTDITLKILN